VRAREQRAVEIAQRLGGRVQVSSSPGKGVQVRVLLGPV
jgi:signal transduction histidine kinase